MKVKELVIASGKGGAGKTSFSACLAELFKKKAIACDCDVDASNLNILLKCENEENHDFFSGQKAEIIDENCIKCGACENICRFDAINNFKIDELSCEGCKVCFDVCESSAIKFEDNHCGEWMISRRKNEIELVHAKLFPGEDNSGRLVTKVREEAKKLSETYKKNLILIDAPPGIGCPVIASLGNTTLLLIIVESSVSGIHDAKRLINLSRKLNVPCVAVLNKSGLDDDLDKKALEMLSENNVDLIGKVPFSKKLITLLEQKKTWLESDDEQITKTIEMIHTKITKELAL